MRTVFPPNQIVYILKKLGYIGITNKECPFSGQGQEVRAEIHNGPVTCLLRLNSGKSRKFQFKP